MVIEKHVPCDIEIVQQWDTDTERGISGFGSSEEREEQKVTLTIERKRKLCDVLADMETAIVQSCKDIGVDLSKEMDEQKLIEQKKRNISEIESSKTEKKRKISEIDSDKIEIEQQ